MENQKLSKKEIEEIEEYEEVKEEMEEDTREDVADDQQDSQMEFQEGYGPPDPEERHNAHTILSKAISAQDTLRTTDLDKDELGKPIFNVRFLLDMEDIADFYLAELCEEHKMINKIAEYFRQKIVNITDSGMSKEGFTMKLNTTRNVNVERTKRKVSIDNLKQGKRR